MPAGVTHAGHIKLLRVTRNVSPSGAMQAEATESRTLEPSISKELQYSTNAEEYTLTAGKTVVLRWHRLCRVTNGCKDYRTVMPIENSDTYKSKIARSCLHRGLFFPSWVLWTDTSLPC